MSLRRKHPHRPILCGQLLESRFVFSSIAYVPGRQSADSVVTIQQTESEGLGVRISLDFTDDRGNPLASIEAGEEFQVRIYLEDLRSVGDRNAGVVSAYMNLLFDSDLAEKTGPLTFGNDYTFLSNEGTALDGAIVDINAAANFIEFLDGKTIGFGEKLFAVIPFRVRDDVSAGVIRFETHRSHAIGAEVNMFADNGGTFQAALDPTAGEIEYGSGLLAIGDSDPMVPLERLPTNEVVTPPVTMESGQTVPVANRDPIETAPSATQPKPRSRMVPIGEMTLLFDLNSASLSPDASLAAGNGQDMIIPGRSASLDRAIEVALTEADLTRESESRSDRTSANDRDNAAEYTIDNATTDHARDRLIESTYQPPSTRVSNSNVLDLQADGFDRALDDLVELLADESFDGFV